MAITLEKKCGSCGKNNEFCFVTTLYVGNLKGARKLDIYECSCGEYTIIKKEVEKAKRGFLG